MFSLCENDAMFANSLGEAVIIHEVNIISVSVIICRKANIIEKSPVLSNRTFFWCEKRDLNAGIIFQLPICKGYFLGRLPSRKTCEYFLQITSKHDFVPLLLRFFKINDWT